MWKKIPSLLFGLMLLSAFSQSAYQLSVQTENTTRIGERLGVFMELTSTSSQKVNGFPCTVFTSSNGIYNPPVIATDVIELHTFASFDRSLLSLKTDEGGKAYYQLVIDDKYAAQKNYTVVGRCNGLENSTSFIVLQATTPNWLPNFLLIAISDGRNWSTFALVLAFIAFLAFASLWVFRGTLKKMGIKIPFLD